MHPDAARLPGIAWHGDPNADTLAWHKAEENRTMMPTVLRLLAPALAAGALLLAAATDAAACACCTNRGQRTVGREAFDDARRAQLDEMAFLPEAELYVGEGDYGAVEGIAGAEGDYTLAVTRDAAGLTFAFKGTSRAGGSLTLTLPERVSVFEVDTRDAPDGGMGPPLYKEWKLTGDVTGAGDFAAASAAGQKLTLILHGYGNSCTSAIDFAHWTLVMEGPKANYTLIGDLRQPERQGGASPLTQRVMVRGGGP